MLLDIANGQSQGEEGAKLLEEAEQKAGPRVEWQLARLRRARGEPGWARAQLRKAEQAVRDFSGADGELLLGAVAEAALALGERGKAEQCWKQLAVRRPGDARVRFHLLELALQAGQEAEARRLLDEVRKVEGTGVLTTLGEAAWHVSRARRGQRQSLAEARRLLTRAGALRPSWSRIPLLEAEVCELENNPEKALEKYQAALERGETRPLVLRRMLQLLYEQGRYAEASTLVRRLPKQALASAELGRLVARVEFFSRGASDNGDPADGRRRALALARQAAAKDSRDYRDYLWLGQVAAVAGERTETEQALRRARDLSRTCRRPGRP